MRFPSKTDTLKHLKAAGLAPAAVIDVGVLTGTPVLMEAFPDVLHLLIEPEPAHRSAIAANYARIPHRLIEAAASDADGAAVLAAERKGGREAVTHSHVREAGEGAPVRRARLDTLVAEEGLSGPFLLKIDTDGHELEVLAGAEATLAQCACVIVEASLDQLTRRAAPLEAAGLRLFDIVDLGYYFDTLSQADLVFLNPAVFDPPALSPWRHRAYRWEAWREHEPLRARLNGAWRRLAGRILGRRG